MGKLKKRRSMGCNGLDQVLAGVERVGDGTDVAISQSDSVEGLVESAGNGANLEFGLGKSRVVEFNTAEVSPEQSKGLSTYTVVKILKSPLVLE
ncbi:hypothetical protein HG530_003550 [Fusarium avenaceum]|nr:hypothetical protein HG530_003550 [Fusarium avenaceum]